MRQVIHLNGGIGSSTHCAFVAFEICQALQSALVRHAMERNIALKFRSVRHSLGRSYVAVFGSNRDGNYLWGTGVLVDFKGLPIIVSCAHVLDPIYDIVYVTHSLLDSHQAEKVHSAKFVNKSLDAAFIVVNDPRRFVRREFLKASDAFLHELPSNELVTCAGFPTGNAYTQWGGRIDAAEYKAQFKSLTYVTLTAHRMNNPALRRKQPTLEWNFGKNVDGKTFIPLRQDLSPRERAGISGGPVVVGGFSGTPRLHGIITHAYNNLMYFNPVSEVFDWIDKQL